MFRLILVKLYNLRKSLKLFSTTKKLSRLKLIRIKDLRKFISVLLVFGSIGIFGACRKSMADSTNPSNNSETENNIEINFQPTPAKASPTPEPIQTTNSPIGKFDFTNYTYPLPHGWQGAVREISLENGKAPLSMEEEERKIGARYIKTNFGEVTGDGQDEAFVILKIETGGSALPQIVYVFEWKNEKPELIWYFRTGDRADGGLREIKSDNGDLVIELYGQDRYIFGEVETLKIIGDEEQLCCPTYFTRNRYKLINGRFVLQGKRQTFTIAEPNAPPIENMGEIKLEENKKGRR